MLLGIVIVTVVLASIVTGQTDNFDQECNILRTLENLELRVQKQEIIMEHKTTDLLQQHTLLEAQTTQLKHQEVLLGNLTVQLQQQESLLGNQTVQLQQQEALLKNQTAQLQQQESSLGDQTFQLQQQEALLKNQTSLLQQQEASLNNQTAQLQRQEALLKQTEDRIRELEAPQKQPNGDCGVLYANGTTLSGVYAISPDKRYPFDVYCDMTDDGWTVIQRRIDGAVNFNRTWDEYVEGFGDVNAEYWLGLEKIHRLAKDGAEIYFDIGNYDGTREYAHYNNFTVHDVTTLYKMNVDASGYSGSIAELFSWHNDMKFSTYDRDNDVNSGNCALAGGGGWWFRRCYKLGNFNGVFGKQYGSGISYSNGAMIYVKTVTIKLRLRP